MRSPRVHRALLGQLVTAAVVAAVVPLACGPSAPAPHARHVLVVGIDGARPDAVLRAHAPHLASLAASGAYSFRARTQLGAKTKSGPGWASVLTGVEPDKHRVLANEGYDRRDRAYPTFLAKARASGLRTAVAAGWDGILALTEPDSPDFAAWSSDDVITSVMEDILRDEEVGVAFVHFDGVDAAGHASGFSADNPAYVAAVERVDASLGRLLAALGARPRATSEEWLVAVTTDHGGAGTEHGALDADNRTVWLVLAGAGVPAGELRDATHADVHAAVLRFLGARP